jgi:CheY-like chemotaxis protein
MVWMQGESPKVEMLPSVSNPLRSRPLILVVEDNFDNITTIKALLGDEYDIIEATDGRRAIEQAKLHRPTLILLDVSLPVMDGFQVFTEIRREERKERQPAIPIIAVTARAMAGDREEILAFGFNGYVSKPVDGKLLGNTIRRILDGAE